MGKDKGLTPGSPELRALAQERLLSQANPLGFPLRNEESQRLIHELQVHQIELELQNEELLRARAEREEMETMLGRYSDLYDFAPAGYFNLDRAGVIRAVNLTGAELLGVVRSQVVNRRLDLSISLETRPIFHDFLDKVFASGVKETCELVLLKERHSSLFVQLEALVSETGHECRAVAVDITERKRSDAALKTLNKDLEKRVAERTEELAGTINNLRDEIVERGRAEERTRRQNRLYAVLSGTNQAIARTKDRDTLFKEFCLNAVGDGSFLLAWVGVMDEASGALRIVAADGAVSFLNEIKLNANEALARCSMTEISLQGACYVCNDFLNSPITRPWHQKGRAHGIRSSASLALKQEGRVIGALTLYAGKKDFFDRQQVDLLQQVGADISFALDNMVRETRRQEAEEALRQETAERLRAVETLREQEQMLIQQSRLAAMGEMIGNIAHQWRQPLNLLGLTVQQLLMFYDLDEFDRTYLAESVDSSMALIQHMSKTIDDFRNYFKPDKDKVEFKVKRAVAETLSLLKGSLQNPQISVEFVAKDDPIIHGYPNEFAQVLLNIVVNAKDVLTERETSDPKVTITVSSESGFAVVTVADNAGGVPAEILDKIFDPFFTTKGPGGTGIGLFMSKTIIEKNMGGRLLVRNITHGAEFRIEVCEEMQGAPFLTQNPERVF